MHSDWRGQYSKRLAKSASERGRRMARARWVKWQAESHLRPEPEPKPIRTTGLSWAVRDDITGHVEWLPMKSARDTFRRVTVLLKHYRIGYPV